MNITPQQSHAILTAMAEAIDSNDELNDGDIEKISHFAVAFILAEVERLAQSNEKQDSSLPDISALKRIAKELKTYIPEADKYKGKFIHKVWAKEIETALSQLPSES